MWKSQEEKSRLYIGYPTLPNGVWSDSHGMFCKIACYERKPSLLVLIAFAIVEWMNIPSISMLIANQTISNDASYHQTADHVLSRRCQVS